jgi:hypothetical protein
MAKYKRTQVGSVCKAKEDGKPDYIKMRDGKVYRLESAKQQLASLEDAVAQGKLDGEVAEKVRERINKIPSFVRFEIIELVENKE